MLELLANCYEARGPRAGTNIWLDLELYPAMLGFYAAGIAAIAASQYETLFEALRTPQVDIGNGRTRLGSEIVHQTASQRGWWNEYMGDRQFYTPVSMRLEQVIRMPLERLIPLKSRYEDAFDRFECLCSLDEFHFGGHGHWASIGNFVWRQKPDGEKALQLLIKDAKVRRDTWAPLRAGFFGGKFDVFEKTMANYLEVLGLREESAGNILINDRPVHLSDKEILERLVALNHSGPRRRSGDCAVVAAGGSKSGGEDAAKRPQPGPLRGGNPHPALSRGERGKKAPKLAWPKTLAEQATAVHSALVALGGPADEAAVAARFRNSKKIEEQVGELLDTLASFGRAGAARWAVGGSVSGDFAWEFWGRCVGWLSSLGCDVNGGEP